ncbi:MAG: 16S rRNA (adenine(1518)-N(6)/adenine(1519)-N(6))-dimethyltransferase RsmA [Spirochaetales bacterium]|nr:16S rRNA (adenine(1518)-N(6)/adenine(1519)-N(6))-dimethyltransferase RsmA [Spirochaetales bacterium]
MEPLQVNYDSPSSIRALLESEGLAMSKRFGQNFLIDRSMRERILDSLAVEPGMSVWEIGPGIGAMTEGILARGVRLTAFEIDYGFARLLDAKFGTNANFSMVTGDFLKTWRTRDDRPDRIFGNLPYNAALAIIADLLERDCVPPVMVFTVQKEAARRIAGSPGSKDYSSISVLCSSVCDTRMLFDIGHAAFWPQPRVTSSVVRMIPARQAVPGCERKAFSHFVRAAFSSRRKTMRNNLMPWVHEDKPDCTEAEYHTAFEQALSKLGVSPTVRAEALSPAELYALYKELRITLGLEHGVQ